MFLWTLDLSKAPRSFETSGNGVLYPATQRYIPAEGNPQPQVCENLKTCIQ
jgi:hypothetical protein